MIEIFPKVEFHVDAVRAEDVEALVEIHAGGFRRGWSSDEFETLIADVTVTGLVLRRQSFFGARRVIGFVLTRVVAGEAEILSVAVEPGRRGQGHGRRLMEASIRNLYADRVPALFLEVDEDNAPAVTLYRKLGFIEVGRRKGYYADGGGKGGTALVLKLAIGKDEEARR